MHISLAAALDADARDEEAFQADRRLGLGGSDMAAILGLDPERTALDVYLEKVGLAPPTEPTPDMLRGRALEPEALRRWMRTQSGQLRVNLVRGPVFSPEPWLRVHPDLYEAHNEILVEAKVPRTETVARARDEGLKPAWIVQAQTYLLATTAARLDFSILDPNSWEHYIFTVEPDRDLQAHIYGAGFAFWTDHVVPRVPPPMPYSISPPIRQRGMQRGVPAQITLDEDPQLVALAALYREATAAEKSAEMTRAATREAIVSALREHSESLQDGATYVSGTATIKYARRQRQGSIDLKAVRGADPLDRLKVTAYIQEIQEAAGGQELWPLAKTCADLDACRLDLEQFRTPPSEWDHIDIGGVV